MTKSSTECQTGTADFGLMAVPWNGTPREADKMELAQYVLYEPAGSPFSKVVRDVFGSDAVESAGADYKLARRFFERYNHFKIERRDGLVWVEPCDWALLLKSSRQTSADSGDVTVDLSSVSGALPSRAPSGRAAQTARSVLRDRCEITPSEAGAGVRAALRHALAAHREGVDTEGMREDRVSAPSRVAARQEKYLTAFEIAAQQYNHGVMCTLTSRPGESGDMIDTAVAVNESINPLRDHLKRQTPSSGRPMAVVVREVTGRGVLHLHVAVFDVRKDQLDQSDLGRYWSKTRGHGYISDVAEIRCQTADEGHQWVFADHADAPTERGRYVRVYLGEMLCKFREVAEATPEEIHRGKGRKWWKVALLWACGLPVVSISSTLRQKSSINVSNIDKQLSGL